MKGNRLVLKKQAVGAIRDLADGLQGLVSNA
jgi:hypothetical protein